MQFYDRTRTKIEYHESLHYYIAYRSSERRGIIYFLHGGPVYRYYNRFDTCIDKALDAGFIVVLINYTGSSGYGIDYIKELFNNGGKKDLNDIVKVYNKVSLRWPHYKRYFWGDSYGGYLTIRLCLSDLISADHYYATNAFTDIRYQLFFSTEARLIKRYFLTEDKDELKRNNPMDIAQQFPKNLSQTLTIINGKNDTSCPFQQIKNFNKLTNCKIIFIEDYPHFKIASRENDFIINYIIEDVLCYENS